MSASQIPYELRLFNLEKRLKGYQANYEFAIANNNPVRQTKYANSIRETKLEIEKLERDRPLESNERLRAIIKGLEDDIKKLDGKLVEATKKYEESEARIDVFINPPKIIPPEETDIQTNVDHECPNCGRTFKGAKGVAAHQRSGACHKAS
jgi:chromosome segregation ATPase